MNRQVILIPMDEFMALASPTTVERNNFQTTQPYEGRRLGDDGSHVVPPNNIFPHADVRGVHGNVKVRARRSLISQTNH